MAKERTKKNQKFVRKSKTLKFKLEDWGKPHGVTGNGDLDQLCHDLFYRYSFSREGAHFELFREHHHTDLDVENAKKWLKENQDVLTIKVVKEVL